MARRFSCYSHGVKTQRVLASAIASILLFSALAKGAHDLWAATLVYLFLAALAAALFLLSATGRIDGLRWPLPVPLALLLAAFTISFLNASNPSESFLGWMDWCAFGLMLFATANVFRDPDALTTLMVFVVPFLWVEAGIMAWQAVQSRVASPFLLPESAGTIINANLTSAFLVFWVPPLVERVSAREGRAGRSWFWVSGLAACFISLLFAQSSWAWFVVAAGFLIHSFGAPRRFWFAAGIVLLVIALGLVVWKFKFGRSPIDRLDWWSVAIEMFRAHPLSGVGIGNYPSAYLAYKTAPGQNTLYAHSFLLSVLAETGVVGAAALLFLLGSFLARADRHSPFYHGALFFLIYAGVNLGTEVLSNLLALGLFMGIALANTPSAVSRPRLAIAIVAIGGALSAAPYLLSPFMASRLTVDGETYLSKGDKETAEKRFFDALKLDPRAWEPYAGLAKIAATRKDFSMAVEFQREAIKRNRLSVPLERQMQGYRRFLPRNGNE